MIGLVTFPFLRFFDSVSATFCCSFHSESFLTGDFSVPFYMISLLYICPLFWIFLATFLSLFCDFLSFYVLFLELFSPFYGSNYIPLYLFFMYFCIATILGLIISILPLFFLGFCVLNLSILNNLVTRIHLEVQTCLNFLDVLGLIASPV